MSNICYAIGRHSLYDNTGMITSDSIFTLKYKSCPWNENMTKRIEQFGKKINVEDIQRNRGIHFLMEPEWYENEHSHLLNQAYNLTENVTFKAAFDYCNSL
jgi:metal-sulfur cluster biosynthetic enzyme